MACGNAGFFWLTCGDYARVLSPLHARLRVHWASGIPHALCFLGRTIMHDSGASRREIAVAYFDVIARSKATKQSILLCGTMDCFAEPVIGQEMVGTAQARPSQP